MKESSHFNEWMNFVPKKNWSLLKFFSFFGITLHSFIWMNKIVLNLNWKIGIFKLLPVFRSTKIVVLPLHNPIKWSPWIMISFFSNLKNFLFFSIFQRFQCETCTEKWPTQLPNIAKWFIIHTHTHTYTKVKKTDDDDANWIQKNLRVRKKVNFLNFFLFEIDFSFLFYRCV